MAGRDPRTVIRTEDMTAFQIVVVSICVLIVALDGFDVLVVAFTAPAIAKDWGLKPTDLGLLFGTGLAGMGAGSLFVAPLGDRFGRRPTVLLCLTILCLGMCASAYAADLAELAALRAFTGIGIGAALTSVNVLVAEYASDRRRDLSISVMAVGYPVGATLGGLVAVYLIGAFGWRSVYLFGGLVAALLIPAALAWLPESLDYLVVRRPRGVLERVNRLLGRMGRDPLDSLPEPARDGESADTGLLQLLRPPLLGRTVASCVAYLSVMSTCYFLLSWTPKLLTELGLTITGGISVSLLMNMAGAAGCLAFGVYATMAGARRLATAFMLGLFAACAAFGVVPASTTALMAAVSAVGFCLFASINALYAVVPTLFPPAVRSTGTGLAMTVGRVGAVAGPYLAGVLIAEGWPRPVYCTVLALPMLVAAASLAQGRKTAAAAAVPAA